jgi:uncharacterized membrane protein
MASEQRAAAEEQHNHPGTGMASGPHSGQTPSDLSTEEIIGWILRIGVSASAVCILLGVIVLVVTGATGYGGTISNLSHLTRYTSGAQGRFPTAPGDVIAGLVQFKPYAIIALGLLLLILTPVIRVAASIVIFLLERDYAYVVITAFVLLILIVSFLLGKAG